MLGALFFFFAMTFALSIVVKNPFLVLLAGWLIYRWNRASLRAERREPFVRTERRTERRTARRTERTASHRAHDDAVAAVRKSAVLTDEERDTLVDGLRRGLDEVVALREATVRLAGIEDPALARVAEQARARRDDYVAHCRRIIATVAALTVQGTDAGAIEALRTATDDLAARVAARQEIAALAS